MLGDYDPKGRYLSSEIVDQKIFDARDPHLLKENSSFYQPRSSVILPSN